MLPRNRTIGPPSSPLVFLVTDELQALSVLIFKIEHGLAEALLSSFLRNNVRFQSILPEWYRFSWNGEGSVRGLAGTLAPARSTRPWEERENSSRLSYLVAEIDVICTGAAIIY